VPPVCIRRAHIQPPARTSGRRGISASHFSKSARRQMVRAISRYWLGSVSVYLASPGVAPKPHVGKPCTMTRVPSSPRKVGDRDEMVHTWSVSLLFAPLKEVPDGNKHAAVTAENYVLSQGPETEKPPTKPSGQALAT